MDQMWKKIYLYQLTDTGLDMEPELIGKFNKVSNAIQLVNNSLKTDSQDFDTWPIKKQKEFQKYYQREKNVRFEIPNDLTAQLYYISFDYSNNGTRTIYYIEPVAKN